MPRGENSAWLAVIVAFAGSVFVLWQGFELVISVAANELSSRVSVAGFGIGLVLSITIFFNRWRCIEAFTSQSFEGGRGLFGRLSLLHGGLNAFLYAWKRGFMKLAGR